MRRTSGASPRPSRALLLALAACACAPRDAVVGSVPVGDGGAPTWVSPLATDDGLWDVQTVLDGASVAFGARNAAASDGLVAELRFPGRAGLGPGVDVGPEYATQISSKRFFRFGTFRARVQFATCAPGEEVASAFFLFFNDGTDADGNGLPDNPELDFQVLCDAPTFVVLTAWSDYLKVTGGGERFLKQSHAVDVGTGDVYDAPSETARSFAKTGSAPELARPSFVPGGFYDVVIDWQADRVRFAIVLDGAELTLWTVTDARFVPRVPLQLMFNLWHPAVHWVPRTTAADYPARDAVLRVDQAAYFGSP